MVTSAIITPLLCVITRGDGLSWRRFAAITADDTGPQCRDGVTLPRRICFAARGIALKRARARNSASASARSYR